MELIWQEHMKNQALEEVTKEFVESGKYAKLPTEAEKAKAEKKGLPYTAPVNPETFKDFLDKWVYSVKDQDELLDKIGGSRLMRLKNEPHLGYSTRH